MYFNKKKIQGFVETLQIMWFQNDWYILHRRVKVPSFQKVTDCSHSITLLQYDLFTCELLLWIAQYAIKNQNWADIVH